MNKKILDYLFFIFRIRKHYELWEDYMCEFKDELLLKLTAEEKEVLQRFYKLFIPENVIQSLVRNNDEDWSRHKINKIIQNYKLFLFLNYYIIEKRIAPSKDVCLLWKYHSLTKQYGYFCYKYLKTSYLKYVPYYRLPESGLRKVSKYTSEHIYEEFSVFTCPNEIVMYTKFG